MRRVEDSDGLRREFEILTLSTQVWHVLEYDHEQLDTHSYGQFHEGDTYVVRWHYVISQKGRLYRTLCEQVCVTVTFAVKVRFTDNIVAGRVKSFFFSFLGTVCTNKKPNRPMNFFLQA